MTPITIDFRTAVNDAKRAIREKGWDYRYSSVDSRCVYFNDDRPSCIVGHVFAYEGLQAHDFNVVNNTREVRKLRKDLVVFTEEALMFLSRLQDFQDTRQTWGIAYTIALRSVYQNRKENSQP